MLTIARGLPFLGADYFTQIPEIERQVRDGIANIVKAIEPISLRKVEIYLPTNM
jgi:hypothetical protein